MKKLAILAAAFLVGGAGVLNLQSVKSGDYQDQPKKVTVAQAAIAPDFRDSLVRKMAECGVALAFFPMEDADSQLQIRQLGSETKTQYRPEYKSYLAMTRYEFTLVDLASHKNVWKGQGDFEFNEPRKDAAEEREANLARVDHWSDRLIEQMKSDRLIGRCGGPAAIQPPAPPAGQAQQMRMKIGDVTYDTPEAAETGMRAKAAEDIAKLTPQTGSVRGGLLLLVAAEKPPQVTQIKFPNQTVQQQNNNELASVMAYAVVMGRVGIDASADALRKYGLFSEVQLLREDDVPADDFRNEAYKLYYVPGPPGHWVLIKQGGGSATLNQAPGSVTTPEMMQKWLNSVKTALDALNG